MGMKDTVTKDYMEDPEVFADAFNHLIQADAGFRSIEIKAGRVIGAVTGTKLKIKEGKDEISMCQAIEEMIEDACREAVEKTAKETAEATACRMLSKGKFSYEEIAELTELSVEEILYLAEKMS